MLITTSSLTILPAPARAEGNTSNCVGGINVCPPGDVIIIVPVPPEDAAFTGGAVAGAITGGLGVVGAVSASGSVVGLSAAGITSGLAAIGATVGGGMLAGVVVTAAAPAVAAVGVGVGAQLLWNKFHSKQSQLPTVTRSTGFTVGLQNT